jgi:hypothetical protein
MLQAASVAQVSDDQLIVDFIRFNPKTPAHEVKKFTVASGRPNLDIVKNLDRLVEQKKLVREWTNKFRYEYSVNKYFNFAETENQPKEQAVTNSVVDQTTAKSLTYKRMSDKTLNALVSIFKMANKPLHNIEVRSLLRTSKNIDLAENTVNGYVCALVHENILKNVGAFQADPKHRPRALYALADSSHAASVSSIKNADLFPKQAEIIQLTQAQDISVPKATVAPVVDTDDLEDIAFAIMKEKGCDAVEALQRATIRKAKQQVLGS